MLKRALRFLFLGLTSAGRLQPRWQALPPALCNPWRAGKPALSSALVPSQRDGSLGCGTILKDDILGLGMLIQRPASFWNCHVLVLICQKGDTLLCGLWKSLKYIVFNNRSVQHMPYYTHIYTHVGMHTWYSCQTLFARLDTSVNNIKHHTGWLHFYVEELSFQTQSNDPCFWCEGTHSHGQERTRARSDGQWQRCDSAVTVDSRTWPLATIL